MDLKAKLRELKPTASAQTIRTYDSLLRNLFYKHHEKDVPINVQWFRNSDLILDSLKDSKTQTRKTICAAILGLIGQDGEAAEKYAKTIVVDSDKAKAVSKSQTKSASQEANWMEYSDVMQLWESQYNSMKSILNSKTAASSGQIRELVKFMALTLSCGKFFPPRRSEWVYFKVKNIDKEKDNWIDLKKSEFVFNTYKTAKYSGQERVAYPPEFKAILTKYLKKIGDVDFLIFTPSGTQLSSPGLTSLLNNLFQAAVGKKVSTSLLRHIYLSDKYKDIPKLAELEETARKMGHSVLQAIEYVKH